MSDQNWIGREPANSELHQITPVQTYPIRDVLVWGGWIIDGLEFTSGDGVHRHYGGKGGSR